MEEERGGDENLGEGVRVKGNNEGKGRKRVRGRE